MLSTDELHACWEIKLLGWLFVYGDRRDHQQSIATLKMEIERVFLKESG